VRWRVTVRGRFTGGLEPVSPSVFGSRQDRRQYLKVHPDGLGLQVKSGSYLSVDVYRDPLPPS